MLTSLNDALGWRVTVEDDRFRLSDFLLDPDSLRPVYLVLDLGGWLGTDHALVAASLMQSPDPEAGVLPLSVRSEELRRAPHWHEDKGGLSAMLTSLPPLVVGPFGATHAPLAMAVDSTAGDTVEGDPEAKEALTRYERFTDWRHKPVFASDGEAGTLDDMLHDTETGTITHFIVDSDNIESGKLLAVPSNLLRHHAEVEKGGHLVLNTSLDALATAPRIEAADKRDGAWQAPIARHFAPSL